MKFKQLLAEEGSVIIFDGAMGTELQKRGLKPGEPSELMNFTAPEKVAEVIRSYAESGSSIVSANTFCANRYKLTTIDKSVDETVTKAIEIAKSAAGDASVVALDIGPIGKMLRPTGTMTFDEAYDIFTEMIHAGVKAGADLAVLQTFSDLLELKAAVLAVKENSDLPVITSMTFESNGRTFTGCPVSAYAVTASALGADVIGVNCSLGPTELKPIVAELSQWTDRPLMVKPNAGLPDPVTGKFMLGAENFASEMREIAKYAKIIGGCCGTSPDYIRLLCESVGNGFIRCESTERINAFPAVCSGVKTVVIDRPCVIGERINPTGKKLFKEALINSDTDYILNQALEQIRAGADILDVNVGLPQIDEKEMMLKIMESLQSICDLPLQIDSGDPDVIEAALRRYNGKPIVNSVNGKEESLSAILPIVKKYGAAVIGLTLDENGIPEAAAERLKIARKIMNRAIEIGIKKEDIVIDCLTLSVSTDSKAAQTTLEAVNLIKSTLGLKTALGVSNVSFGLPNRELINAAFLTSALQNGLDLPIINPNALSVMGAVRAFRLLNNQDENAAEFIAEYSVEDAHPSVPLEKKEKTEISVESITAELDKAGQDFEAGRIFLPQLILIAENAKRALDSLNSEAEISRTQARDKIILATVKGDIHDIGKNIVKSLLESYGYKVIDLGKDVSPEIIADSAEKHGVNLVGLSALMTTTLPAMRDTISLLQMRRIPCKIMVGGAILTADYAETIGADFYAKDAKGAVDIAKELFK
jgi:5-methyltetrahydrofolate--homocysteine methyltransferase